MPIFRVGHRVLNNYFVVHTKRYQFRRKKMFKNVMFMPSPVGKKFIEILQLFLSYPPVPTLRPGEHNQTVWNS